MGAFAFFGMVQTMKNFVEKLKKVIFYEPLTGTKLQLVLHWLWNLVFLSAWCFGIGIVALYLGKVNYGRELFWSYFDDPLIFRLNIIPGFVVAFLFLFITGRVWPSVLSSGLVVLGLAIANHYKMLLRDDPLMAEDLTNILEAAQISGSYTITLTPGVVAAVLGFVIGLAAAIFLMKARLRRPVVRIAGVLLLIVLSLWLYKDYYLSDEVYEETSNMSVEFASMRSLNRWNETDKYCCRGFMYSFINSSGKIVSLKPEGYSRRDAQATLESLGGGSIPDDEKVNIVSIMLEAYCDLSIYDSVETGEEDPYEFFHALQEESVHGALLTNIFAGGTIDTERCYIAGSTIMYEYRAYADSYARYFAEQGYRTEFCHPGYSWFYNRQNVMDYLGFEACYFHEDRYTVPTGHVGDDVLFADIISLYEDSKAAGEPYFNFSVTYQNHGPYPTSSLNQPDKDFVRQSGLSDVSYTILSNYLEGISRTDAELEKLVEYFRNESEPVILVLFGDHKPWLGDGSFVYSELGISLSISDTQSFYNYYETPYIIWANEAAKEVLGNDFTGEGGDISPCYLMMKLFDYAGWEGDGYMQALRELYENVTIVNDAGIYCIDGKTGSHIEGENLEKLKTVEYLQYYRMKDAMR